MSSNFASIFDATALTSGIMAPSKSAPQSKPKAIYIPVSKQLAESDDSALHSPTLSLPSLSSSPVSSTASSFLLSPTSGTSSLPVSAAHTDDSSYEELDAFTDAPSSFMNSPAFEPVRSISPVPAFDDVFVAPQSARIYSKFELLKLGEDFKSAIASSSSSSRRGNDYYTFIHDRIGRQLAKDAPWVYVGTASTSDFESTKKSKKIGNTSRKGNKRGKKNGGGVAEKKAAPSKPASSAPTTTTLARHESRGSSIASSPASTTSSLPHLGAAHTYTHPHSVRGPALPSTTSDMRKKKPSQFTRISGKAEESDWRKKREVAV